MRLVLFSLLLASTAYALKCKEYLEIVYGDPKAAKFSGSVRRILDETGTKDCEDVGDCSTYYMWARKGDVHLGYVRATCSNETDVGCASTAVDHTEAQVHGDFTFNLEDCQCNTEFCNGDKEEARKKWNELFGSKVPPTITPAPTTTSTIQATEDPKLKSEKSVENYGSGIFSAVSVLFAAVLIVNKCF